MAQIISKHGGVYATGIPNRSKRRRFADVKIWGRLSVWKNA